MNEKDQQRLLEEIERKRQELRDMHGMISTHSELPPEMESAWLDHIIEFERQWQQAEAICIYDRVGRPEFRPVEQLSDTEIKSELERILGILEENAVCLDTICEVPPRELYRFITEELFEEEIDDIRMPGMVSHFIYEEYHPNHEYDLKRYTEEGIHHLLDPRTKWWNHGILTDRFRTPAGEAISRETLARKIVAFKESFEWFEIEKTEINEVKYDLETRQAQTRFEVAYQAKPAGGGATLHFSGSGIFLFEHDYGYWYINGVELPGLQLTPSDNEP
jgi:hypothetical protein